MSVKRWAAASAPWLPWRLLLGPIFQKEVIVSGRRRGVYAMRGAYTLLLAAVTGIAFFIAIEESGYGTGRALQMERLQQIAPVFGEIFGWMQLILLTLVGTVLTASAFSEERTNRTLHSLMTTPLTSAQIVFGKLSSRLLQIVILALIPMPVLLGLRIFGGLEAERIVSGMLLAITSAGFSASISLFLSIFNRRAWSVMVLSIVIVFIIEVAPVFVSFVLLNLGGGPRIGGVWMTIGTLVSPFGAFLLGVEGAGMVRGMLPSMWGWGATCVTLITLTFGMCLLSALVLRPATLREKARTLLETDASEAAAASPEGGTRKKKRAHPGRSIKRRLAISRGWIVIVLLVLGGGFAYVIGVLADQPIGIWVGAAMPCAGFLLDLLLPQRRAHESREVGDQPVFWRELRSSFVGSRGGVIILAVFVGAIMFIAYREATPSDPDLHMGILAGLLGVQLLAASTMTTGRIAAERDARTWDTLLCTPLSARRIVGEKLLAGFVQLLPIPAAMFLHMIAFLLVGALPVSVFLCVGAQVLAATALLTSTGLLVGMWRSKATGVAVTNLSIAFLLWIAMPIGTFIVSDAVLNHRNDEAASWVLFPNPMVLTVLAIDGAYNRTHIEATHQLGDIRMSESWFTVMTLASAATQAGLAAGAAWLSVCLLRKRSLRSV